MQLLKTLSMSGSAYCQGFNVNKIVYALAHRGGTTTRKIQKVSISRWLQKSLWIFICDGLEMATH